MNLYEVLDKLNIVYEEVSHEKVMTVEEAKNIENMIEGIGSKNLFLTDKKNYYLVILEENKRADIKELMNIIGCSRLSFASSNRLKEILDLEEGSVTPFGIINDKDNKVMLLIDKDLKNNKLLFHPNTNTKTISVSYDDLIKFIEDQNHKYINF
ncbi:MAG: prolyl-tRNA synthetase associated domain-containing protein [Firmicutes bacterium]|nr:prolyl-tRNA synthetase associated domain-containing protein [Bacillota bacterium]